MSNKTRKNISLVTYDYSQDIKSLEIKLKFAGYNTYVLEKDFDWITDYATFSSTFLIFLPERTMIKNSSIEELPSSVKSFTRAKKT